MFDEGGLGLHELAQLGDIDQLGRTGLFQQHGLGGGHVAAVLDQLDVLVLGRRIGCAGVDDFLQLGLALGRHHGLLQFFHALGADLLLVVQGVDFLQHFLAVVEDQQVAGVARAFHQAVQPVVGHHDLGHLVVGHVADLVVERGQPRQRQHRGEREQRQDDAETDGKALAHFEIVEIHMNS